MIIGPCLAGGVVLIIIIMFCIFCRLPVNEDTVNIQPGDMPPQYGATGENNSDPAPAYTEPQKSNQYSEEPPPYPAIAPTAPPNDENSLYPSI